MGICAFFSMWNLFGVVVFQRSMLDWRRGMGSVCHGYMCILLYVKLIWCSGFPEIYAWLEEEAWGQSAMGICAFFSMWNLFGVLVLHRSMVDWRRGHGGQSAMGICAFFYMSNFCNVIVFQRSMLDWEEGAWSQSAMGICAFFYMSNFCSVVVFQRSMLDWRRGHGVSLPWVYVHSSICETYLV